MRNVVFSHTYALRLQAYVCILVVFQKCYILTPCSCRFKVLFPKLTFAALLRMQQPILAEKTFNLYECKIIMQVFTLWFLTRPKDCSTTKTMWRRMRRPFEPCTTIYIWSFDRELQFWTIRKSELKHNVTILKDANLVAGKLFTPHKFRQRRLVGTERLVRAWR